MVYDPPVVVVKEVPVPVPGPNLCPVFVPEDYHTLPDEGIRGVEIFAQAAVPHGFVHRIDPDGPTGPGRLVVPLHFSQQVAPVVAVAGTPGAAAGPGATVELSFSTPYSEQRVYGPSPARV